MRSTWTWSSWAAALLALVLIASTAGARQRPQGSRLVETARPHARRQPREGAQPTRSGAPDVPVIGPTSWSDALDDAAGLSSLDRTQLLTGSVRLSRTEAVGEDIRSIVSLAEGPGSVLCMGTTDARLWSYDPATGITLDLGTPVPDECDN
jgi:hypothetical protein